MRLKEALVSQALNVWWQEDIQCGREWHGALDLALAEAGCVVVVWSTRSMHSPWVRHEASQAIARGVYPPARIEPIEIESPYNRIQATDLLNWNGEPTHPGFQNLLARVYELLPPPIPLANRLTAALRAHVWTAIALVFAVFAAALLIQLNRTLSGQVTQQARIAAEIQRTLQPLQSVEVSVYAELAPEMPGLSPDPGHHARSPMRPSSGS